LKHSDLARREVVKGLAMGSAGLLPVESLAADPAWKPKLFNPVQTDMVAMLAELIIPETDSPGARAALAHQHIDLVLSEETPEIRREFLDGLQWLNQTCRARHNLDFIALSPAQQLEVMKSIASPGAEGHAFFLEMRRRTVFAYYTSEIGIHKELHYKGHQVLDHWTGCPHPDHHGDPA
jgi:hypothetical protein